MRDSTLSSIQALSGAVFHNLNTEAGWSGSPLFREENGAHKKTAMHIAAGPPGVPLNIAVSAPSLQKQMIIKEAGDIALNCPFMQGNGVVFSTEGLCEFSEDAACDESDWPSQEHETSTPWRTATRTDSSLRTRHEAGPKDHADPHEPAHGGGHLGHLVGSG